MVRRAPRFRDRIPNSRPAVAPGRRREQFGLNNAGPVSQRQKLHWLTRDLMMRALLDNKAARRHGFTDEITEAIYWAVTIPTNVVEQFEWMAADGETEKTRVSDCRRSRRHGSLSGMAGNCSSPGGGISQPCFD